MPYRGIASLPTPLLFSLPSTFKSMLNSIDNQPTYSEKSGLSRWCWQGAGFRGAGAHQLVNMPEKKSKQKDYYFVSIFLFYHHPPFGDLSPQYAFLEIKYIAYVAVLKC